MPHETESLADPKTFLQERVSPDDYRKFLEILMEYWTKQRSVDELHGQMKLLFSNDASLLEAFQQFLPKSEAGEGAKEESH